MERRTCITGKRGDIPGHKASLFEGGIREPAILSWPNGWEGGQVRDEVAAMMDIAPTFWNWPASIRRQDRFKALRWTEAA